MKHKCTIAPIRHIASIRHTQPLCAFALFCILFCLCILLPTNTYGQNVLAANKIIKAHPDVYNMAVTENQGTAILFHGGFECVGCPASLERTLGEIIAVGDTIIDVQISEQGAWSIVFGNHQILFSDDVLPPQNVMKKALEYAEAQKHITQISFNDQGHFVIMAEESVTASSEQIMDFLREGVNRYGNIRGISVSDESIIALFDEGVRFLGECNPTIKDDLQQYNDWDLTVIKHCATTWFFRDNEGQHLFNW